MSETTSASSAMTNWRRLSGQVTSGRLVVRPNAAHLTIHGDPSMSDLYRASFDSPAPSVKVQGGSVTVHYPRMAWLTGLRACSPRDRAAGSR